MKTLFSTLRINGREPLKSNLDFEHWLFGSHPHRAALRALAIAVIGSVVFSFALQPIQVVGNSMAPSYYSGGVNMVNRLAYRKKSPERGDVVAAYSVRDRAFLIKRVIGLPGDTIAMVSGKVFVNGEYLSEPYALNDTGWSSKPINLGPNQYWVIGDNRSISVFGPVNRADIIGKVLL